LIRDALESGPIPKTPPLAGSAGSQERQEITNGGAEPQDRSRESRGEWPMVLSDIAAKRPVQLAEQRVSARGAA
jgi:hypothetical protein